MNENTDRNTPCKPKSKSKRAIQGQLLNKDVIVGAIHESPAKSQQISFLLALIVGTGVLDGPIIASFVYVAQTHPASLDPFRSWLTFILIESIIQLDILEFDKGAVENYVSKRGCYF